MNFTATRFSDLYLIELNPIKDNRGFFLRSYCRKEFRSKKIQFDISQINRSYNPEKGTLRGLHFQKEPYSEPKVVQVINGRIFDVIVDLRRKSPTFGQWMGIELSRRNNKGIYIPRGFAHGFQTLSENCEIEYFMGEFYDPKYAVGIQWNDPFLKIKWPLENPIMSERDKNWPSFKSYDFTS